MLTSSDRVSALVKGLCEREESIGITESILGGLRQTNFVRNTKPAVSLKTLYSDFVVRELSPFYNASRPLVLEDWRQAQITVPTGATDTEAVCDPGPGDRKRQREDGGEDQVTAARVERVRAAFTDLVDEADLTALISGLHCNEKKVVLRSVTDKEKRTVLHQAVRTALDGSHVSVTEDGFVVVVKATSADRREQKRRSHPLRTRKFTHFTLYKENLDSTQVFRSMANHLHISSRQFQFCGTKDKRAVTLQRVAIRDMDFKKLLALNDCSFGPYGKVRVCSLTEADDGLKLGDAVGNHFNIVLRVHEVCGSCAWTESQMSAVRDALESVGAVNYFGPQRFGTTAVLTSDVGLKLLQGDYAAAIERIFASRACIVEDVKTALPFLAEKDYDKVEAIVPHYCFQERDILQHLRRQPNDYLGALQTLPRTLAMLYFHAVQSLVWNRMASRRLRRDSVDGEVRWRAEVGDLVLEAVYARRLELRDASYPLQAWTFLKSSDSETAGGPLPAVHVLTDDDDLTLFALSDVVLPVPGPDRDLQFPRATGCTKDDYVRETQQLGVFDALLGPEASSTTNVLLKVFHYHGTYRPLCVRPQRVSLQLSTVPSWRAPVTPTDLERMEPQEKEAAVDDAADSPSVGSAVQALVVQFSLPPGSYATSVLREFSTTIAEEFHRGKNAEEPIDAVSDDTHEEDR